MTFDLLDTVQPADGWFCVVGIKKGPPDQRFFQTRKEVDDCAAQMVKQGKNVFFGLAKFKTNDKEEGRKKPNVQALRAFWLDIDCGEAKAEADKGYATQDEAVAALMVFVKTHGLPRPILVNSGGGLHVYWPLSEDVTREQWEPVAAALKAQCQEDGLLVDPAVFEVSRILRIPDTQNFKEATPRPVTVMLGISAPVSLSDFAECFSEGTTALVPTPKRRGMLADKLAVAPSFSQKNASFLRIIERAGTGNGCEQLVDCVVNNATLSEPMWRAALSIANKCVDRDTAIRMVSKDHPQYDPDVAEVKAAKTTGPHACTIFNDENPNVCTGCPHWGKITSPIQLGDVVIPATEEEMELVQDGSTYKIPELPYGYTRPKGGGIYLNAVDEESEPFLIYEDDVYAVKRMHDPVDGECVLMRLHMPQDGVREFTIPNFKMVDEGEVRKALASQGVMCPKKQFAMLIVCVMRMVKELKNTRRTEHMRLQFGWADKDTKFIIGDTEISADGPHHSPPSSTTKALGPAIGPKGSYDKWKEVFDLYGREGLEPHAFAALTAFGAPLLKFTGQRGALINLIHPTSGTGKTTILHMCNSVYGHPADMTSVKEDTMNAKIMRLGVYNNLPYTIDEMTNMSDGEFSNLAYSVSQGKGKERMKSSSNELRLNLTTWQTIAVCSSNASFYQKLGAKKMGADGEMMRLLEYSISKVPAIDQAEAKQMFDFQLLDNYGHAGPIYIQWLVENLEEAKELLARIQSNLDRELGLTQRERIWSAVVAANIAGGIIAQSKCNLISWDMGRILGFAMDMIKGMRTQVTSPVIDVVSTIGDYMTTNIKNTLVVNGNVDSRSALMAPAVLEPKFGELRIRYEPDTKHIYLVVNPFRAYCVEYQIDYNETVKELKSKGIWLKSELKRVTKGMHINALPVQCVRLDGAHPELFDVDEAVAAAQVEGDAS